MQEKAAALSNDMPQEKEVFRLSKSKKAEQQRLHAHLLEEYFDVRARIKSLDEFFQRTVDSDLVSACIYEMNAAQQQYAYILQRLKEEGVSYLKVLR